MVKVTTPMAPAQGPLVALAVALVMTPLAVAETTSAHRDVLAAASVEATTTMARRDALAAALVEATTTMAHRDALVAVLVSPPPFTTTDHVLTQALGQDDTYGDSTRTGGGATGRGDDYGLGSGRTGQQESGGFGGTTGGQYGDDNNTSSGGNKNDSTAGKMMEKAGNLFKSDKLQERGAEKRREAGGDGGNGNDNSY